MTRHTHFWFRERGIDAAVVEVERSSCSSCAPALHAAMQRLGIDVCGYHASLHGEDLHERFELSVNRDAGPGASSWSRVRAAACEAALSFEEASGAGCGSVTIETSENAATVLWVAVGEPNGAAPARVAAHK